MQISHYALLSVTAVLLPLTMMGCAPKPNPAAIITPEAKAKDTQDLQTRIQAVQNNPNIPAAAKQSIINTMSGHAPANAEVIPKSVK